MRDSENIETTRDPAIEDRIRRRAYELSQSRQGPHDARACVEDWLTAEREILGEDAPLAAMKNQKSSGAGAMRSRPMISAEEV